MKCTSPRPLPHTSLLPNFLQQKQQKKHQHQQQPKQQVESLAIPAAATTTNTTTKTTNTTIRRSRNCRSCRTIWTCRIKSCRGWRELQISLYPIVVKTNTGMCSSVRDRTN